MAEVYRAKDTRLGRDVAIKVVSETLGADGAFLERFDREAKLAASLAHPNVVALHDVGLHDGKPYFVTELLQGESLRERLAKGPIPLPKALEWAAQMAQGLAAAHERGIVHRDLKPENVFITRDGHVKLLDFGIAKLIESAQAATPHGLMDPTVSPSGSSTGTGMVLGTPGYMSPEQVRGDPVDARTDFFSLGAVLYEMLSGRRTFLAGPVVESGYAILHNEPDALPESIPPAVAQVVRRCLEKDATGRFQSARDLGFYLELLRAPTGSGTPPVPGLVAPAMSSRWRGWLWPLGAALLALAAIGVAFFVGQKPRLRSPSVLSLIPRLGMVSAGRFNPDGRVIFSAAWEGQPLEIFSQSPGTMEAQPLGLRDTALLAVSTTGELAVLVRPDWIPGGLKGTLAVVPGAGGTPREVAENITAADWSPTSELAVVRLQHGRTQLEYPLGKVLVETSGLIFSPRVSPSGDSVAFIDARDADTPWLLKFVDGKGQVRTLASGISESGLAWAPSGEEVWFTKNNALQAVSTRTGEQRLVYQGISDLGLEDISRDGRALVNSSQHSWEVAFADPGKRRDIRLSIYDSELAALSDDGRQALLTLRFLGLGMNLRPTDGGAPLKLGPGEALDLAPDSKWVLAKAAGSAALMLVPVGPQAPKKLVVSGLVDIADARFFHDGKRIVVKGRPREEDQFHLYTVLLDGGLSVAMSDADIFPFEAVEVSRDDRFVVALDPEEILTVYRTDGGSPLHLTELGKDVQAVAWSPEGHLWVRPRYLRELPSQILLYDITKRRVLQERPFSLNDATGVLVVFKALSTPDAGAIAFQYERQLGHLYLLDGLEPPRN